MNPITPPRPKTQRKQQLYTPKTPFSTQKPTSNFFQSPLRSNDQEQNIGILSPVETPHRKRKTNLLGAALDLGASSINGGGNGHQKCLFPPTPSTIGSGRVKTFGLKETKEFTKKKLNLSLLDDEEENLELEIEDSSKDFIPCTPGKNLITRDLANKWQQKDLDYHQIQDLDDSDMEDFLKPRKPLENPFISSSKNKATELIIRKNDKPLDSIVLINKKGEKIIRDLTRYEDEDEMLFPRRNLRNGLS